MQPGAELLKAKLLGGCATDEMQSEFNEVWCVPASTLVKDFRTDLEVPTPRSIRPSTCIASASIQPPTGGKTVTNRLPDERSPSVRAPAPRWTREQIRAARLEENLRGGKRNLIQVDAGGDGMPECLPAKVQSGSTNFSVLRVSTTSSTKELPLCPG